MGEPDSERLFEHAERLASLETRFDAVDTTLGRMESKQNATLDAVDKLLAWRHRIDGAKHVVTVVVSALAALATAWFSKYFLGPDNPH